MYTRTYSAQTQSAAVLRKGRKIVMDRLEKRNGLRGSAHTANKRKESETNDVSDSKRRADSEPLNILYSRFRRGSDGKDSDSILDLIQAKKAYLKRLVKQLKA
jgi:hypothetical protein